MESIKEALCLGSMAGSAAGSIVLFPSRTVWFLDISTFTISLAWFVGRHWKEVKAYARLTFPPGSLLSLAVAVLSNISLVGFLAWMPVTISLFILLTVYSMPPLFPHLLETPGCQIVPENALSIVSVMPGSIQDIEDYVGREDPIAHFILCRTREHDLVYMRPTSRTSPTPSSRESDIDLEDPQDQMRTSNIVPIREVSEDALELETTFSRSFWKDNHVPAGRPIRYEDKGKARSSTPDSEVAHYYNSVPDKSTAHLLD